jgi:hypothetical protein
MKGKEEHRSIGGKRKKIRALVEEHRSALEGNTLPLTHLEKLKGKQQAAKTRAGKWLNTGWNLSLKRTGTSAMGSLAPALIAGHCPHPSNHLRLLIPTVMVCSEYIRIPLMRLPSSQHFNC